MSRARRKEGEGEGAIAGKSGLRCSLSCPVAGESPGSLDPSRHLHTPRVLLWLKLGKAPARKPVSGKGPVWGKAGAEAGGNHYGASEGKGPRRVLSQWYRKLVSLILSSLLSFRSSFAPQAFRDPSETIPHPFLTPSPATVHKASPLAPWLPPSAPADTQGKAGEASRSQTSHALEHSKFPRSEGSHPAEDLGSRPGSATPDSGRRSFSLWLLPSWFFLPLCIWTYLPSNG